MNYIIEYLTVGAVTLLGLGLVIDYTINHLDVNFVSYYDMIELEKKQTKETLKMIDVMQNPFRVDVLNTGENPMFIKKLFVDVTSDDNYTVDDTMTNVITPGKITTITPSISGTVITIITENNKEFNFLQ